jgi:hypothetical protein
VKDDDCPLIPGEPKSAEEFCQIPECESGVCEIGTKSQGTIVPAEFQSENYCEVLICDPGIQRRYSLSRDYAVMNTAVPDPPNECSYWECHSPSQLNKEPTYYSNEKTCGPGGTGFCDGNGTCVIGS